MGQIKPSSKVKLDPLYKQRPLCVAAHSLAGGLRRGPRGCDAKASVKKSHDRLAPGWAVRSHTQGYMRELWVKFSRGPTAWTEKMRFFRLAAKAAYPASVKKSHDRLAPGWAVRSHPPGICENYGSSLAGVHTPFLPRLCVILWGLYGIGV
jgi:hypothetical protein